ncbi:MAG: NPCBM/NEW2 domain-containing protein [Planctomycetaceae bacterium]|nr:NPCBM/NEW2 domain-containing protein [Planctomycetaceae bacterium]
MPYCILFFIVCQLSAAECFAAGVFEITDTDGSVHQGQLVTVNQNETVWRYLHGGKTVSLPTASVAEIRNVRQNPYLAGTGTKTPTAHIPNRYVPQQGTNERHLADSLDRNRQQTLLADKEKLPPLPSDFRRQSVAVIDLTDSSQIPVLSFRVNGTRAVFRLFGESKDSELPLEHIAAIRLAVTGLQNVSQLPDDWQQLLSGSANGDQLVVGTPGTFDVYYGILKDITDETISFATDGETLPVPRKKVFGIILHRTKNEQPPQDKKPSPAALSFWNGTRLAVNSLELRDGKIHWKANAGLTGITPLYTVEALTFKQTNIVPLWEQTAVLKLPNVFNVFDEVRRKQIPQPQIGCLDGIFYPQCLLIPAPAELEYMLPANASEFRSLIGIDDRYRPYSAAELQITADTQILGTWTLRGDRESFQVKFDLPKDAKVLRLKVSALANFDIPSVITITEPKIILRRNSD